LLITNNKAAQFHPQKSNVNPEKLAQFIDGELTGELKEVDFLLLAMLLIAFVI
jgi:hypothetical protein